MNKTVTREEMKQEAIKRMHMLKMHSNPIKEFGNEDLINRSETIFMGKNPFYGILYWVDEEDKKLIKEAEKAYDVVIFHIIKNNYVDIGVTRTMLAITKDQKDWERERKMLSETGIHLSIVHNMYGFECGAVTISPANGGIKRVIERR